jgi:hypothetical protein
MDDNEEAAVAVAVDGNETATYIYNTWTRGKIAS